jgi:hypothetical protein
MKSTFKKMAAQLGMLLAGTLLAATAVAQCGNPGLPQTNGKYHKQAWHPGDSTARLELVDGSSDPIVGMWQVIFTSEGSDGIPDGTVVDNALVQWHADGTEIMNSGLRPPASSNFCLGVWQNMGSSAYKLNHFAISWDPSNLSGPLGPAQIKENITLAQDQNAYAGKFTIDQYDESGNLKMHVQGTISAHRITIATHAKQLL